MKPKAKHIPRRPQDEPFYTNPTGMDFEKRRLIMAARTITANMIADGALDYGLSFYAEVTTYTDTTHFKASGLASKGTGAFKTAAGTPYEIYVFQADGAAPEGQMTPVVAYTSSDGTFEHAAYSGGNLAVGDIVLVIHPLLASLGTKATTAATGAVTTEDDMMSYIKQLVNGLALDGSASYTHVYSKTTVPGWLHGFHMVRRILFVVPETLSAGEPTTAHNIAIKAELDKLGVVKLITQADALTYPDFEAISLCVLGSPLAGTAWTVSNLAHVKSIYGLPVLCVDGVAAEYLAMGTDGGNAATKTVLNAIANIEASILGIGQAEMTGLAAGANTVAASGVTFATLNMSDSDVTEIWYAWETTEDNTDVLIGEIRQSMPDGTVGVDADGTEVPGTLAFYGCAYSMGSLNTLGQAVFHLYAEKLLHSSTAGLAVLLSGNVGSLVNTIGTKKTAAATGAVSNAKKMMAYVKQLITLLIAQDVVIDDIHDTDLPAVKTVVDAIQAITDTLVSSDWKGNFNWDTSAFTTDETDISNLFSTDLAITTRRKYLVKLDLTAVEADGSFSELYLAVKEKVDGTNYRAIDRKLVTKAQIAATAEPGIIIEIPATSENIQITMQMETALADDATIYYAVVKEHLE